MLEMGKPRNRALSIKCTQSFEGIKSSLYLAIVESKPHLSPFLWLEWIPHTILRCPLRLLSKSSQSPEKQRAGQHDLLLQENGTQ